MAIDTRTERSSMLNFGEDSVTLPVPIGSLGKGDRFHLLGLFSERVVGVVLRNIQIDFPGLGSVEVKPG